MEEDKKPDTQVISNPFNGHSTDCQNVNPTMFSPCPINCQTPSLMLQYFLLKEHTVAKDGVRLFLY